MLRSRPGFVVDADAGKVRRIASPFPDMFLPQAIHSHYLPTVLHITWTLDQMKRWIDWEDEWTVSIGHFTIGHRSEEYLLKFQSVIFPRKMVCYSIVIQWLYTITCESAGEVTQIFTELSSFWGRFGSWCRGVAFYRRRKLHSNFMKCVCRVSKESTLETCF